MVFLKLGSNAVMILEIWSLGAMDNGPPDEKRSSGSSAARVEYVFRRHSDMRIIFSIEQHKMLFLFHGIQNALNLSL